MSDHFLIGVFSIDIELVSFSLKQNYFMLESLWSRMLYMKSFYGCFSSGSGRTSSSFWILPKFISTDDEFQALMSWLLATLGYCCVSLGYQLFWWTPNESNSKFLPSQAATQPSNLPAVNICQFVRSSSMTEFPVFLFLNSCFVFMKGLLLISYVQVCCSIDGSMLLICQIFSWLPSAPHEISCGGVTLQLVLNFSRLLKMQLFCCSLDIRQKYILIIVNTIFFQSKMIKQSFLRNYSLSKIYCEAEDEKKKLKVFYIRKVNKILKQKQQKERQAEKQRKSMDIREERMKEREFERQRTRFRQSKSRQKLNKEEKTSKKLIHDEDQKSSPKKKADIRVTEVRFLENEDQNHEFQRQNLRLKTNLNKTFYTKRTNKKNTVYQSMCPLKREDSNVELITKSINHSRHSSQASCEENAKTKQNVILFQDNDGQKEMDKKTQTKKAQKMVGLANPLKINCNFKRHKKTFTTQIGDKIPLGTNLQFTKIF